MRIIFMGTPAPAAFVLEALIKAGHEIICVVSQPDKPRGRGQKVQHSAVAELAMKNKLNIQSPDKVKDPQFIKYLKELNADLIVVVAYGKLLPKEILSLPKYGCLNVHASLLPKYRGAAPIQRAILNGETKTGITIMRLDEGLDTGDILLQKEVKIADSDTTETLLQKLFTEGSRLLLKAIELIAKSKAKYIEQNDKEASFAPSIKKEEGHINWNDPAQEINNQGRALVPWPSAYTSFKGKQLKVWNSAKYQVASSKGDIKPGQIVSIEKGRGFVVSCGTGFLEVLEVQPESGKRMGAYEFAIGHQLKVGDRLG